MKFGRKIKGRKIEIFLPDRLGGLAFDRAQDLERDSKDDTLNPMTLPQIKQKIAALSEAELKDFSAWFENHLAEAWDRQIENDANNGNLDRIVRTLGIDLEVSSKAPTEDRKEKSFYP